MKGIVVDFLWRTTYTAPIFRTLGLAVKYAAQARKIAHGTIIVYPMSHADDDFAVEVE